MGILLILFGFYFVLQSHPILGLIFALIGGYILESVLRDIGLLDKKKTSPRIHDNNTPSESNFDPAAYQDFLDFEAKQDAKIHQSKGMSHADWVKQDAEKHKRWTEQEDRAWAEDFMDEMDNRGKW